MFYQISENNHDKIIAKLQHFADKLDQKRLEKEALAISVGFCVLQTEIKSEISVYQEILDEYYDEFQEILTR